jgi:nucleotide-binding universal stress UspA family protein
MRILVATDGSRGSAAALNFAIRLAVRDAKSELIVLSVEPAPADPRIRPFRDESRDGSSQEPNHAKKVLERAARKLNQTGTDARFHLISARGAGEIPEAISREADRLRADLVVVGSEGRDTLNEWVLGGTALRLIYVAKRPVTVVRAPRRRQAS